MIRQMTSEKDFEKIINKDKVYSKEEVAKMRALLTSIAHLDYEFKKKTYGKQGK